MFSYSLPGGAPNQTVLASASRFGQRTAQPLAFAYKHQSLSMKASQLATCDRNVALKGKPDARGLKIVSTAARNGANGDKFFLEVGMNKSVSN